MQLYLPGSAGDAFAALICITSCITDQGHGMHAFNNDSAWFAVLAKRHQVRAMQVNSLQTGLF